MEFFTQFLITLGSQTLATALLAYLAKTLLTHWMDKAIEDHKAKLTLESETFKARLKAEGDMMMVRYSQLISE